jgi:uncharacterized protein
MVVHEVIRIAQPEKIILFGSRARGDARENSDFDIGVQGRSCSEDAWNRLIVDIMEEPYTLYPIDLVEIEKLTEAYQDRINQEGVLLWSRPHG